MATFDVSTPTYPNMTAIIDDADVPFVLDGKNKWLVTKQKRTFYVIRHVGGRKGRKELLHRKLLGLTDPRIQGDHRNGNGLDNRRENLRPSTNQQNSQNGIAHHDSTSQYRGVSWDAARDKWTAGIGIAGKRRGLGRFNQEQEAALAYDIAAQAEFGEFARLNFPKVQA